jgi:drug/metabolite transporter (DMT)-like permease
MGVICVGLSQTISTDFFKPHEGQKDIDSDGVVDSDVYLAGAIIAFCSAWTFASVGVFTRAVPKIHYSVWLLHYSYFGAIFTAILLIIEHSYNKNFHSRIFHDYDWADYGWMLVAAILNSFGLQCNTIAASNEKPAIIQTVLYIGLLYAFSFDVFLFGESFNRMEIIGISIVLFFTAALTVWNLCRQSNIKKVAADKVIKK